MKPALITAVRAPTARGENLTSMLQLAPAARFDPQVLVWANSATASPVADAKLILRGTPPRLVERHPLHRAGSADRLLAKNLSIQRSAAMTTREG